MEAATDELTQSFFSSGIRKKDVVSTLEAMQKVNIDILKPRCTLPNLANNCPHKSPDMRFYHFTEADKDLLEKAWKDVVSSLSIVSTRKAVVDETFIEKSTNIFKSFVGNDASQLYPHSKC